MATYDNRKDERVHKYIDSAIETKVSRLVNNSDMADNQTHWHRGYIAALRDFFTFYNKDLPKTLNEE